METHEIDCRDFNVEKKLIMTCIRYCRCIANVLSEKKCTLMFANVQYKGCEE